MRHLRRDLGKEECLKLITRQKVFLEVSNENGDPSGQRLTVNQLLKGNK